ncbi:hypothetical protein L9F63_010380, partial [Diploptera punctata]
KEMIFLQRSSVYDANEKELVIEDLKAEVNNLNIKLKQDNQDENNQRSELLQMQEEIITLKEDISLKDGQIQGFIRRIEDLMRKLKKKTNQGFIKLNVKNETAECGQKVGKTVEQSYTCLDLHINKVFKMRNNLTREIQDLSKKLTNRTAEVEELSKTIKEMGQSAKDTREALTAEVADKHDRILALRREIQLLEERCHQADMQTHFKDNIIKELRKDLKIVRSKYVQSSSQSEYQLTNILQQLYKHSNELKETQSTVHRSPTRLQEADASEMRCTSPVAYQKNCTPEKLSRSNNEKSYYSSNCGRMSQNSSHYNSSYLDDVSDMADHLGEEETYYEVRRRNSPLSKDDQNKKENKSHIAGKGDSVSVPNISRKATVKISGVQVQFRPHLLKQLIQADIYSFPFIAADLQSSGQYTVTGKTNENVISHKHSPESEIEAWNDLIEQMKGLSATIKARKNERMNHEEPMMSDLEDFNHVFDVIIYGIICKQFWLRDIQAAEQNQTDSERRIIELKDVLMKSYNGIEESLGSLEIAKLLYSQNIKSFLERSEESEEAFKNLKAEMNYLAFFLKSREKQVKYLEGMIESLNELLENSQKDLEVIKNETFAYKKEKENLHNDHEKCVRSIERLEKSLKLIYEEKQKVPTKLESKLEERSVELAQSRELDGKSKLEALQSNLMSREKVAKNQEEMIKILQDSVNLAQKEQDELQKKLIDAEAEKEKLMINLEESEKKAGNLQEALLVTKTQLEELQGKNIVKS